MDLVKAGIEANTIFTGAYRIYLSDIGPDGVVAVEWKCEDLDEMQAAWEAWETNLATPEFWEEWDALTERGGEREVWQLVAKR